MASDFCNWTRGGALVLGLKALYLLRTCRKCNAQKSFPFLGYYERHRSNFRPEIDNIKINSFGLQHDCNCLYIEHLLCFNIPTYKLIRLQGAEYDKPSCFTNAIKRGTENQHSFPLQGEQTQLYLVVEITTPFPNTSFFSKPRRNHHHYNAPHPPSLFTI